MAAKVWVCILCSQFLIRLSYGIFDDIPIPTSSELNNMFGLKELNTAYISLQNNKTCSYSPNEFNITQEWFNLLNRPFNVCPRPRDIIGPKFILNTRTTPPYEGEIISIDSEESIAKSDFDPKRPTKLIIHGFIDNGNLQWIKEMTVRLLYNADLNVIDVDWGRGSLTLYTIATANTRLVGQEIAKLINLLKDKYKLNPEDVHIIGHSLGAHTAGYAGDDIEGLGRITGLDPASPFFQGMPEPIRLDPSDAKFVDIIHTDGNPISIPIFGFGMVEPCGHIDFYPNGGKSQPGCEPIEKPMHLWKTYEQLGSEEACRDIFACNHNRAIRLFSESINSKCQFHATRCQSYEDYLQGKCSCGTDGEDCAIMGLQAKPGKISRKGAKYFLTTNEDPPYCRRHYRIVIYFANPPDAADSVKGTIKISLHGDNNAIKNLDLTKGSSETFEHGKSHTFLIMHTEEIGPISKVEINWIAAFFSNFNMLAPKPNNNLYVSSIHVSEIKYIGQQESSKQEIVAHTKHCCVRNKEFVDVQPSSSVVFNDDCNN